MSITRIALVNLKLALTVAIRFSATRRQFGPKDTEEVPVLEYQLQVRFRGRDYQTKQKHLSLRGILSQVALRVFAYIHYSLCLLFQQWRLIPYLAAAYVFEHFSKSLFMNFVEFQIGQMMKDKSERQVSEHGLHVCASLY